MIAAVGISGPLSRMPRQRVKELTPIVVEAGEAISTELNEIAGHRKRAAGPSPLATENAGRASHRT